MAARGLYKVYPSLSIFCARFIRPPEAITKISLRDPCDLQVLCAKPYSALINFMDSAFLKKRRVFKFGVGIVSPLMFMARRPTAFIYALFTGTMGWTPIVGPLQLAPARIRRFISVRAISSSPNHRINPGLFRFCAIATTLAVCSCEHLRIQLVGGLSSPDRAAAVPPLSRT